MSDEYIMRVDFGDEFIAMLVPKDKKEVAIEAAKERGGLIISLAEFEITDTVYHWEKINDKE
jgi:hypothetical protein